jgi:hypothetical protein
VLGELVPVGNDRDHESPSYAQRSAREPATFDARAAPRSIRVARPPARSQGAGLTPSTRETVSNLMPQLRDELVELVAIPSVSVLGYPQETRPALLEAHDLIAGKLEEIGVELETLEIPDAAPVIYGELPGPAGAKSWAGLAGLLLLFLLIAQFIAYFNYSNIPEVLAVKLGDALESADIGALWLLVGVVFLSILVNLIIPQSIAKWALLASSFRWYLAGIPLGPGSPIHTD